jgi:pyruvate/2-oxoglutarate dehydrogenase complex dihydrolipoamide acyltransferase (E2) component
MDDVQRQLQARVDDFVADLTEMIRAAALEAVHEALGAGKAAPTKKRATKKRATNKRATKKAPARRGRPRGAASMPDPKLMAAIVKQLKQRPIQGVEELSKAIGVPSAKLKPSVGQLLDDGAIKRKGKARGTKYSAK